MDERKTGPGSIATLWLLAFLRLVVFLLVGVVLGAIFHHPGWGAAGVLGIVTVWHFATLFRLERWLKNRNLVEPPEVGGVWGDVITRVVRLHRRKRFHKMRLLQVFRELRRSTAAMPEGVVVLSGQREIVWFNKMAVRLLALRPRLDRGLRIDNLVRNPEFIRYLKEANFSSPVIVKDSTPGGRYLALHLVPYGDGQQLLLVRDVTREQQVDEIRKDFVANASHELRSPLTVINGYLDSMADDDGLGAVWRDPIAEMKRQAERMNSILNDLLELSRLESSQHPPLSTYVDVGGLLSLMRKEMLSLVNRPHEISLHLDSDAGLQGAQAELHSAFENLITNAVKYTPPEGRVDIRWWVDTEGAHLSVTDTGIGIGAEHLPRLTERFYRVDAGRSRRTGGSGLGLAIVKHALERHNATLEIKSEEGKGSTFICHFPPDRVVFAAATA